MKTLLISLAIAATSVSSFAQTIVIRSSPNQQTLDFELSVNPVSIKSDTENGVLIVSAIVRDKEITGKRDEIRRWTIRGCNRGEKTRTLSLVKLGFNVHTFAPAPWGINDTDIDEMLIRAICARAKMMSPT